MQIKLSKFLESIKVSFWFIPVIIIISAISLAFLFIAIDTTTEVSFSGLFQYFFTGGADGARSVLSSIASSMMTLAGITFSITIVTLTLASSQLGPRVIRNFIKNKLNQAVLGTYVATFIYCLLVLRTVTKQDNIEFVPNVSLLFAMLLAVANIILLIIFIHHIATAIQADNVISNLSDELDEKIEKLFPEDLGQEKEPEEIDEQELAHATSTYALKERLPAKKSNYLQSINRDALFSIAKKQNLLIHFDFKPGHFLIKGTSFITVYSNSKLEESVKDKIINTFIFGKQRSPTQDAEFIISQIVEIASRALSPGINDPFTAITCIDKLGAAIANLTDKKFPSPLRYDDEGILRLVAKPVTFTGLVDTAFNQIRQYGKENADILIRMMERLSSIAERARTENQKKALQKHIEIIERAGMENLSEVNDQHDLQRRYLIAKQKLGI